MPKPKTRQTASVDGRNRGMGPIGEDAAIEAIRRAFEVAGRGPRADELWIGDDTAVVLPPPGPLLFSVDAAVADVHADLELVGLDDLGWKALTAAVSDLGAMGGRPLHAVVTICVPPGTDLDRLVTGLAQASTHWGCPVVGGDLSSSATVMVSVAVTGTLDADEAFDDAGPPAVRRSGARPGDALFVTGPLGASAAGLRLLRAGTGGDDDPSVRAHRRPQARLAEGWAARLAGVTAMMDVSDGLAIDLDRVARASGVGVALDEVPVAPGATVAEALGGGEDYQLLMATPDPSALARAFAEAGVDPPIRIGRCTAEATERTWRGEVFERQGWEHTL